MHRSDGGVTVEFVLWLPIVVAILAIAADAALILGTKAQVLWVVQDANRAAAVGRLRTEQATADYVRANIGDIAEGASVVTLFSGGIVSTTVTMPTATLTATGLLSGLGDLRVTVNAQHMLEA